MLYQIVDRRAVVAALVNLYPPRNTEASKAEMRIMRQGASAVKARCASCHKREPIEDASRSATGWENILVRSDFWQKKWRGASLYKDKAERGLLFKYLNLVAGADGGLPAGAGNEDSNSPVKLFQNACFACHATTLKIYNWNKTDPAALSAHARKKLEGTKYESSSDTIVKYLLR